MVTPPVPANFHAVFGISANVPNYPGGAMQIDVSGDSIIGETPTSDISAPNLGDIPTHAAISPNHSRVFVTSAGSVEGGVDVISSFTPAFQSVSLGAVTTIGLPGQSSSIAGISESGNLVTVTLTNALNNVPLGYAIVIAGVNIPGCIPPACNPNAYNGAFTLASSNGTTITYVNAAASNLAAASGGTVTFPPQPVFLASSQNTAMYVANYNSNSVSAINTSVNVVGNSVPVGVHPVSMAEIPNGTKLYVANEGDNTVSSLNIANITTLSPNVVNGFSGTAPIWVVARGDSQKVYVLTQGNAQVEGQLVTIDVATDTVTSSLPVGAGANFVLYDPNLNRLYVTNPNGTSAVNPLGSTVYVFSDTGGANDTPVLLKAISFNSNSAPCLLGCMPTSVTALPDGSRFYVASYQLPTGACPDTTVTGSCMIPSLTVFDANSLTPKIAPALTLLTSLPPCTVTPTNNCQTNWPFVTNQYAVPLVTSCSSPVFPALYTPGATRFRVFTTAAADSTRVYVSMCDAGYVAVINTTGSNANNPGGGTPVDTVITDLPAAFSSGPLQPDGYPANQSPIFLLTGQ